MKVGAVVAVAAVSMGALGMWSATAGAAIAPLPTFPDNIIVFPNRDFITVEGFADHVTETALIEVVRPGVGVVGSAKGVVSGGDVAFEVNHPGGYCWGAGTGLNVTPDIVAGDEVTINFGGGPVEYSVTTQAATVITDSGHVGSYLDPADVSGKTLKLRGYIQTGANLANFEQRIVEPALVGTEIAKRDVRALFGPLTLDPRGTYQSGVEMIGPNMWEATYVFQDASTAAIADAATGERAMTWQFTDPAANRQGLTIAEFGEPGGPGFGGCPNGPLQSGPPAPSNVTATIINGGGAIQVDWTVPSVIPGTQPILGYRVTAVGTEANGEKVELGKSITNPLATRTIISGFGTSSVAAADTFHVEVSSLNSAGYTFPPAPAITPVIDTTAPVPVASMPSGPFTGPFDLTLSVPGEPSAQIFYTLDGTSPLDGSGSTVTTSVNALHYVGPITVTGAAEIRFAAFDLVGNASNVFTAKFTTSSDPAAAAPTGVIVTPGVGTLDVAWTAVTPVAAETIVNYDVLVYDAANAVSPVTHLEVPGDQVSAQVPGLLSEHTYWVAVAAKNSVNPLYGTESARVQATTLGVTANAGADQVTTDRPATVTLTGSGSAGAQYSWTRVNADGTPFSGAADQVVITNPGSLVTTVSVPAYTRTGSLGPWYFKLTVTKAGSGSASDIVKVTPVVDPLGITTARWKVGDFRIVGFGTIDGATVTLYNAATNLQIGQPVTVALGAWEVRLRATGQVVTSVYAISNKGGRTPNFTVATR